MSTTQFIPIRDPERLRQRELELVGKAVYDTLSFDVERPSYSRVVGIDLYQDGHALVYLA